MITHETHSHGPEFFDRKHAGNWPLILLVAAGIGVLCSLLGAILAQRQFAFSWLFAFTFFFTLCAGSLFWILVHHAVDAEWSVVVRRQLENLAGLIPVLAFLFIPVLIFAPALYGWWTLTAAGDPLYAEKEPYLNVPFFLIRVVIYFTVLIGVALLLRMLSVRQDGDGAPRHTLKMRKIAIAGIPLFALSLTFAAFDWLMSLEYKWFSTMWGVYIFAGAAGSSMSLLVLIITALRGKGYLQKVVTIEHYHIMGKLMLAFCIFWAYIGFSQYMLIWYANIPEETSYFLRRNIESWNVLSTFLVIGRFFLPFPLLLLQGTKKNPRALCAVAVWIILMQMLDVYIIIMPMLHETGFAPHLLDIVTVLTIGSILALVFLKLLGNVALFPTRDPRLAESVRLTN